ncbi:MAG TPA: PDR/VanB family oxidoreductase [Jatrophihabitans sp.]|nr:PDR/VanB family oxidoreductase [Jatrophihabitans sp.]
MTPATQTQVSEFEADVRVSEKRQVADRVVELTLTPTDATLLPSWTPGAHVDLVLSEEITRQYSLCGSPSDQSCYRIAVLNEPESRGGSRRVHDGLQVDETVRIRGPRNHFALLSAPRYLFIAGGIGITPMIPMIEAARAAGADWRLHYGGRDRASMAFADQLAEFGDRVQLCPQDQFGMLDLEAILGTPAPGTLVYCCGPGPLLNAVEERCATWPANALHIERFTAKPREDTGADGGFEIVLQRSGLTATVGPDETVFEAIRKAGVSVLGSCLEGICGTCETGVLEGEVDHRDSVLDEAEQEANDCMMVCVSRARSARLVLDT